MEDLINSISDIVMTILNSDPAIYRIIITDRQGMEIAGYVKHWERKRRPQEFRPKNPQKNPIYPLLNAITLNAEKFLNFLRNDRRSPFILSWYFEKTVIFAASSPYGFIGVFCEPDVNPGLVKKILRDKTIEYNQLVSYVFEE